MEVEKKEETDAKVFQFAPWVAVKRRFGVDSPFFAAGNVERELIAKQISLEITEEEKKHIVQTEEEQHWQLSCPIVGCGIKLKGLGELESHYLSRHSATCSVCTRVFPTTRLLNLHVSETHDSFFQAKLARNHPMYECLVEGCSSRFHSDSSRHQHLVDKHHFPRSFRFHSKKRLSQKQRQRQKAHSASNPESTSKQSKKNKGKASKKVTEVSTDRIPDEPTTSFDTRLPRTIQSEESRMDVDQLATAVSRLSTISQDGEEAPAVLSFGHRRGLSLAFVPGQITRGSGHGRGRSRGRGDDVPSSAQPV